MPEQDIERHDVFGGVENRPRDVELQESLNKLGRKGCKVAADEARSTCEEEFQ